MSGFDFSQALNTKVEDFEPPKELPPGTYTFTVSKAPEFRKVGEDDRYDVVRFPVRAVAASDDVDPKELEEFGDISNAFLSVDFFFDSQDENSSKRTMQRLRRFLEDHLQVDDAAKKELKQALAESVNHQFLGTVEWKPRKDDPEQVNVNITRTAPVE